MNKLQT